MEHKDIHKLIEDYFDARLNMSEEATLKTLLSQTDEDAEDIREAKATLGIFATRRKLSGRELPQGKQKSVWSKMKYAAIFVLSILFDAFTDIDDSLDNKLSK